MFLERRGRMLRVGLGGAVLAAAATAVLMGQSPASNTSNGSGANRVIEAERFVLRDASGGIRARLFADESGRASLSLTDRTGKTRIGVGVTGDGAPILVMGDKDGKTTRVEVSVKPDGTATIGLADGTGAFRSVLDVKPDGATHVAVLDEKGRSRGELAATASGKAGVQLSDAAGQTRLRMGLHPSSQNPGLWLQNKEGMPSGVFSINGDQSTTLEFVDAGGRGRAKFGIVADGTPGLALSDKDGRARASLAAYADGANLLFYDRQARSRVQLGVWSDGLPALGLYDEKGDTLWASP